MEDLYNFFRYVLDIHQRFTPIVTLARLSASVTWEPELSSNLVLGGVAKEVKFIGLKNACESAKCGLSIVRPEVVWLDELQEKPRKLRVPSETYHGEIQIWCEIIKFFDKCLFPTKLDVCG